MKKYIAELIGTFGLTAIVILSVVGNFPIPTPVVAGFTLLLFVYTIGHISGAHINPAVTLGALSIKMIDIKDAAIYILMQFLGAGLALVVINLAFGVPGLELEAVGSMRVGLAELIGMFFFTFGIASVVYAEEDNGMSGVVIGGSLFFGIAFASLLGSNGVLNPAVALGIRSFNLMYILGPIVGSVLGMWTFKYIK